MPVYENQEAPPQEAIPEHTILVMEIVDVKEVEKPWKDDDGNPVNRVEFSFVVREPEGENSRFDGRKIWGETPTTFSRSDRCKLRAWAQEILSEKLGNTLDTDILIGRRCRGVVHQRIKKNTDQVYNFVHDVLPDRNAQPASYEAF